MKILNIFKSFLKPPWNSPRSRTNLNLLTTFSAFKPHGNQDYKKFVPLLIENINQTIPAMSKIAEHFKKTEIVSYIDFYEMYKNNESESIKDLFETNFNFHGSDKALNFYHYIYSCLIPNLQDQLKILEIGLGTNNVEIVSSMGKNGTPGASLRAFRETLPNSMIYGADIDKDILFEEEKIKTFYVNQIDQKSLDNLANQLKVKLDLIIDDGLHYQLSNLNSLSFALDNLAKNGFLVIEDIGVWTLDTWRVIEKIIPENFQPKIIKMTETNFVFLIKNSY